MQINFVLLIQTMDLISAHGSHLLDVCLSLCFNPTKFICSTIYLYCWYFGFSHLLCHFCQVRCLFNLLISANEISVLWEDVLPSLMLPWPDCLLFHCLVYLYVPDNELILFHLPSGRWSLTFLWYFLLFCCGSFAL